MLTCRDGRKTGHASCVRSRARTPDREVTYMEVRHAGFFELVPEPPGDDVHRDVMGDDPTGAGHGGLDIAPLALRPDKAQHFMQFPFNPSNPSGHLPLSS